MVNVVGVRFRKACKIYYFDPADTGVVKGDFVIVENIRGLEYGEVVIGPRQIDEEELICELKPVIRKATDEDGQRYKENCIREKEAFNICLHKIKNHDLPMNLVNVEFTFDVGRIIFYFTADGRVDFRELVKDLAAVFHTRIELRQIGVRDEARMLGGIGVCGRSLCCATFLGDFQPVSIRMAKNQHLSLNPSKISGVCGRLLCCLQYEDDNYTQQAASHREGGVPPRMGAMVGTASGEGRVVGINRQNRTAQIQLAPNNIVEVEWDEIFDVTEVTDE